MQEAERAKDWTERAMLLDPDNRNLQFNLGCSMVRLGEHDAAIELLGPVIDTTTRQGLEWMRTDITLDPVRDHPRFKALIAAAEARLADVT